MSAGIAWSSTRLKGQGYVGVLAALSCMAAYHGAALQLVCSIFHAALLCWLQATPPVQAAAGLR
jgi:hypothetical protein